MNSQPKVSGSKKIIVVAFIIVVSLAALSFGLYFALPPNTRSTSTNNQSTSNSTSQSGPTVKLSPAQLSPEYCTSTFPQGGPVCASSSGMVSGNQTFQMSETNGSAVHDISFGTSLQAGMTLIASFQATAPTNFTITYYNHLNEGSMPSNAIGDATTITSAQTAAFREAFNGQGYYVFRFSVSKPKPTSTVTFSAQTSLQIKNHISVDSASICPSNCVHPSPHLHAVIYVNGSVPLTNLHVYINGTDQGSQNYTSICCLRNFTIGFESGVNNNSMPILAGKTYEVTFAGTFRDNTTSTSFGLVSLRSTVVPLVCSSSVEIQVNASEYCAIDVTGDTVLSMPGHVDFLNSSITFMGVKFETNCPPGAYDCPNPNNSTIGAISLNMTFPDNSAETVGTAWGTVNPGNVTVLSKHTNPRAGFQLETTIQGYQFFLLVQEANSSASLVASLQPVLLLNPNTIQSGQTINITVLENHTLWLQQRLRIRLIKIDQSGGI